MDDITEPANELLDNNNSYGSELSVIKKQKVYHFNRNVNNVDNIETTKQGKPDLSNNEEISIIMSHLFNYFIITFIIYWNKFNKIILNPEKRWIKLLSLFIIIISFCIMMISIQRPSSFIKRFADSTNSIFNEIDSIDLPASDAIMMHTVSCRRVANIIERSPAFKNHGNEIALNLRLFGEKVMIAGQNLRKMYRKGSFVFTAFDIEIDGMMKKLEILGCDNIKYFGNRLNKLANIIKDFRIMVVEASKSVADAENTRDGTEKYIIEGNREAENFIDNTQISHNELSKTREELRITNDIMKHLHNTATHLDKINKILIDYEDKLYELSTEMSQITENYDDILTLFKTDLRYLKNSVNNLKNIHNKFIQKESSIE